MSEIKLSKNFIKSACKLALNEDLYPSGDITSNLLNKNQIKKVKLVSNETGIIGGLEFAKETFKKRIDNLFTLIDTSGDGKITHEEFQLISWKSLRLFRKLAKNISGTCPEKL